MRTPTQLLVEADRLSLKGIKQFYVAVDEEHKLGTLMDLYESVSIAQSVIFANKRDKVNWIARQLSAEHHTVSHMHSDMPKGERAKVMAQFRSGSARVLIATDLVARGIDVQHVNIVVNFDVSADVECYLHRIGRSGRFGKKGIAINFVSEREVPLLRAIEAHYKIEIAELPMDFAAFLDDNDE
jgi:translation initiation factor 4A